MNRCFFDKKQTADIFVHRIPYEDGVAFHDSPTTGEAQAHKRARVQPNEKRTKFVRLKN